MSLGTHERQKRGITDDWLTPPAILEALGPFDLDPCASLARATPHCLRQLTILDDGLSVPWSGRVWLNPPYGAQLGLWLAKLAHHGHGTALTFARTETTAFYLHVWRRATALLFIRGRVQFLRPDGTPGASRSGAPSVLVAYGEPDAERLESSGVAGGFVRLQQAP